MYSRQVAVSAYFRMGEPFQKSGYQIPERKTLHVCTGIGRTAQFVKPAFVADSDAIFIVTSGMGTGKCYRTGNYHSAISEEIVVITRT